MTTADEWQDILASRYRLGARRAGVELDCLGTVLEVCARLGICAPDPWADLRRRWIAGDVAAASGFPPCWFRRAEPVGLHEGDVLLFYSTHPWVAIVARGYVWSADADLGSAYARPADRWRRKPAEVWTHDPAACPQRSSRD
jgi:hypothetical protein